MRLLLAASRIGPAYIIAAIYLTCVADGVALHGLEGLLIGVGSGSALSAIYLLARQRISARPKSSGPYVTVSGSTGDTYLAGLLAGLDTLDRQVRDPAAYRLEWELIYDSLTASHVGARPPRRPR